jgi:hypothetical protein
MGYLLANRTEADFQHGAINAIRSRINMPCGRGERLQSQIPSSMMRCPCGERCDIHDPVGSYIHRGRIYAKQATDEIHR